MSGSLSNRVEIQNLVVYSPFPWIYIHKINNQVSYLGSQYVGSRLEKWSTVEKWSVLGEWPMVASPASLSSELLLNLNMVQPAPRLMGSSDYEEYDLFHKVGPSGTLGTTAPMPSSTQLPRLRVGNPDCRNSSATSSL